MLSALFTGPILSALANSLFGTLATAWEAYVNKQVTQAELNAQIEQALIGAFATVETQFADSVTKTFDSFMKAAQQSKIMQWVWAMVAVSQLIVLLWHQMAIPAITYFWSIRYPSSGATVDWAYALVMFCLGGGAFALRSGPSLADQLKSLTKG